MGVNAMVGERQCHGWWASMSWLMRVNAMILLGINAMADVHQAHDGMDY